MQAKRIHCPLRYCLALPKRHQATFQRRPRGVMFLPELTCTHYHLAAYPMLPGATLVASMLLVFGTPK